jgi:hypothetical protein
MLTGLRVESAIEELCGRKGINSNVSWLFYRADYTRLDRESCKFGDRIHLQFFHQVGTVTLDRALVNTEFSGNLFV